MKRRRRKQYIVNPAVQYKFFLLILLSVLIPTLLTFTSLFHIIHSIVLEAQVNNELVYTALLLLGRKIYVVLFVGFVFITILLLNWGLIFTHRIVGPIYRLERELDNVISGKKISKIRFRKNDAFKSLAEKVNTIITRLQKE